MADLWRLDATAQADAIRRGDTTPSALLDMALERVARLNPQVNAVIDTFEDRAREQIADLDAAAPFAGVPLLLKDAGQELEGTRYALGTPLLKEIGYVSTETTEVTHRLMRAGFVVFGKTNVSELSSGFTVEPEAFGPTRNPWDLGRTVGGSSGGAAAAV
ncbi:MAG: amidase family protein, partial [Dehalococcoidia bacterium]